MARNLNLWKGHNLQRGIRFPSGTGAPYCMVMLVFSIYIKHLQNRFYFCKAKDFMLQIVDLSKTKNLI